MFDNRWFFLRIMDRDSEGSEITSDTKRPDSQKKLKNLGR